MKNEALDLAIKGILAGRMVYSSSWNDRTRTRRGYVNEIGTGVLVVEVVGHFDSSKNDDDLTWAIAAFDRIKSAQKARKEILLKELRSL